MSPDRAHDEVEAMADIRTLLSQLDPAPKARSGAGTARANIF